MLLALEEHLVLIVVLDPVSHDQIVLLFFKLSYCALSSMFNRKHERNFYETIQSSNSYSLHICKSDECN